MRYEQITFENHLGAVNGRTITFGDGSGYYVNENDLRDYEWSYTTANNKIKNFYRGVVTKKLPVVISAATKEEATKMKNDLLVYAEEDVQAGQMGKIWIGEYYLECYIIASSKTRYSITPNHIKIDLTLVTDQPFWVKETTKLFRENTAKLVGGLDYPYDYEHDYGAWTSELMTNNNISASNFRMLIYGAVDEISVWIGANHYYINTDLESKFEYVVIDSRKKIAHKVKLDGTYTSVFGKRDKTLDLFAKIPNGSNIVQRSTNIDITMYDERSEPLWT